MDCDYHYITRFLALESKMNCLATWLLADSFGVTIFLALTSGALLGIF